MADDNAVTTTTPDAPQAEGPSSISPFLVFPVVVITLCAGAALALVNAVTEEPIAASKKKEKSDALAQVMPAFANDPTTDTTEKEAGGNPLVFYAGRDDAGNLTGYGVESATETGYSGHLSLVFGIDADGKVKGVRLLQHRETPGLGTKAEGPDYLGQYLDQSLDGFKFEVTKDGGQVEAISGATITSRAVSLCISQGLAEFDKSIKGKGTPKASSKKASPKTSPKAPGKKPSPPFEVKRMKGADGKELSSTATPKAPTAVTPEEEPKAAPKATTEGGSNDGH